MLISNKYWKRNSWKDYKVLQQPNWENNKKLNDVLTSLNDLPSLVFSGETRKLKNAIKGVNKGENFILQAGNCAESFSDCNGPKIHNFLRILLQMSMVLEFKTNLKIIKIGRIAGQYAKPRSSFIEKVNGHEIPSYRGDIVNEFQPNEKARVAKPEKLLEGYFRSAATLNLIRAFIQGGYNDMSNLVDWGEHFFSEEVGRLSYYKKFANDINNSLENGSNELLSNKVNDQIYISHEGLLLDYEEAFTRLDTTYGGYYDTSTHFLWVGDRTRQYDSAHIEFVSGIGNPIGLKVGPNFNLIELIKVIKKINPKNEKGKLVLISRMGEQVETKLRTLFQAIKEEELEVSCICDPMHGNTFTYRGYKVRSLEHIINEIKSFFNICKGENVIPGGIHLEITDENVTECIGGITDLQLSDVGNNYATKVDPRLNAFQALEIAFIVSELLN